MIYYLSVALHLLATMCLLIRFSSAGDASAQLSSIVSSLTSSLGSLLSQSDLEFEIELSAETELDEPSQSRAVDRMDASEELPRCCAPWDSSWGLPCGGLRIMMWTCTSPTTLPRYAEH